MQIKRRRLVRIALFTVSLLVIAQTHSSFAGELFMYCGAGLRQPVDRLLDAFRQETGIPVRVAYSGSGQALARIKAVGQGDLFLPGSHVYITKLEQQDKIKLNLPIVLHTPVVAVNAEKSDVVKTFNDLALPGLRVGLGDPTAMALGRTAEDILDHCPQKDAIVANTVLRAATVKQLALYVVNGDVDASIIGRADAVQNQGNLSFFAIDPNWYTPEIISVGVLTTTTDPDAAEKLARFIASDQGRQIFMQYGFLPIQPNRE